MTDALRRFARTLVQRLGETPGGPHRAVTIDELRSRLLPYRAYRSLLGFESVEDYDVVVMRLVGEEGGYVRTLPQLAAERCRAESEGPAPNPELLDQLADVTIQIGAESLERIFDESVPAPAPAPVRDDLDIIERHLELEVREPVEPSPVLARLRPPAPPPPPPPPPAPPQPSPQRPPLAAPLEPLPGRAPASAPAPVRAPLPAPARVPDSFPAAAPTAPAPPPPPPPVPEPIRAPAPPPMPEPAPTTEPRPVPPKPQLKPRRPLAPPRPQSRSAAVFPPDAPPPDPPPQAEPATRPTESAGSAEVAESPPTPRVELPSPTQEPARMVQHAAPATATCRSCHQSLPGGRQVVFCPWCGERLVPFACPECHTELEAQWKHCITCGAPVKNPPRSP